MSGGVLAVTGATKLHAEIKRQLEALGFEGVTVTGEKDDGLNKAICNKNPRLVIIDSRFYQDGTFKLPGKKILKEADGTIEFVVIDVTESL
jgi:hypothetical protein